MKSDLPLPELIGKVQALALEVSFDDDFIEFPCLMGTPRDRMLEPNGYYCRALAAYALLARVKHALEVGSYFGSSALAIAWGAKQVTTVDISWDNLLTDLFDVLEKTSPSLLDPTFPGRLRAVRLSGPEKCLTLPFSDYDMLFIDIGNHEGELEMAIHRRLEREYEGIVFYDDILWAGMRKMWECVEQEKVIANWHGDAGVGVVRYRGQNAV